MASSRDGAGESGYIPENHYDFFWRERWSNTTLRRMLIVSAFIHAVVILFTPSARFKPKRIEFPPVHEVQLVKMEPERPQPPPKKPQKKPVVQPKKEKPKVTPPPVEPKKPKKKKKKEEPEKPKVPEEPVEKEKKEEPKPEKKNPPPPKVETKAEIEGDLPLWYRNTVVDTVRRHWDEPTVSGVVDLETVVYFEILRAGTVASARVEQQSADRRWDIAALRAVMESRFPELPKEFEENRLRVHFGFKHEGKTSTI